jgi:hydroxyacylglutathione hydrolase
MPSPLTSALSILTVPAFDDNYLWIVHNGSNALVVDPGDGSAIVQALQKHQLNLKAILLTHHHADHIGGVPHLLTHYDVPVYGPKNDGIACITQALGDGDPLQIDGLPISLQVIAVPGHTLGHIAYYVSAHGWLFCGDTLFAGGCGRLFEGTPAQMLESLEKLASLPDDTAIYCAHEYTMSNLRFALAVEPLNTKLTERIQIEKNKRDQQLATIPSFIGIEKQTNPFLRSREDSVISTLLSNKRITPGENAVAIFAALREWKNNFR